MQIKVTDLVQIFDKGGYSEFKALKGVNAEIKQGEFISIIGHTGSGKTTFIEHLNGLLTPTSGGIEIDILIYNKKIKQEIPMHYSIRSQTKKIKNVNNIRRKVGIVFQFAEYQLFEETILKDIIFGPKNMGIPERKAVELAKKYIVDVGLTEKYLSRSPFELSGGQKRRVALAGILAMEPDYLIFDEPTAGLDPQGERDMYDIFMELHKKGKTIISVTHNLDHALEYTDRTIMFTDGQVSQDGDARDVLYDIENIKKNHLEPPKLVRLVSELNEKGWKIPKVRKIKELVDELKKGK